MSDVNFVLYGQNAMRTQTSAGDLLQFGAENGNAIGQILVVIIILLIIFGLILFFFKYGAKIMKNVL